MKIKILLPLCVATSVCSCSTGEKSTPNIIFILADDLGYGELTSYNSEATVPTPNIDRIALEGVQMTQTYATPVSSPTRSMFLTGKFSQRNGVYHNFDGTCPGIGVYCESFTPKIKEEGYSTAWFGKWHQGWDISNHPMNNGFDEGYGFMGGMHDYYDTRVGSHYIGGPSSPTGFIFDEFRDVDTMSYFTQEITNRAVSFIQENGDKPFYIYMAYNAPHAPYQAPEDVVLKYTNKGIDKRNATRYAMIDVLDSEIGRILATLDNMGLEENTMVIFMSDNGAEQMRHNGGLRGTKGSLWEGGIRVPLVAKLPGVIPAGTKSSSICSVVDMAATFLGVAKAEEGFAYGDGKSLMPYFCGKKTENVHDNLVFSFNPRGDILAPVEGDDMQMLAVRMKNWKLVRHAKKGEMGTATLYNLENDLGEQVDLSKTHPKVKQELLDYADQFLSECPSSCGIFYTRDTRGGNRTLPFVENSMESLLR